MKKQNQTLSLVLRIVTLTRIIFITYQILFFYFFFGNCPLSYDFVYGINIRLYFIITLYNNVVRNFRCEKTSNRNAR